VSDPPPAPSDPPTAAATLTQRTSRGYAYMLAQTFGAQAVTVGGYVALGWLLFEEDFGLYALTTTISTGAELVQRVGLRTILIHRKRHFDRWGNAAFWMSLCLGLAAALAMALLAPIAALDWFYGEPRLPGLILVLALCMPFRAMTIVPESRLMADLRFRYLAGTRLLVVVTMMALTILFAALGFGPYSFVIPFPIVEALRLAVLWRAAAPRIRLDLHLRRWRYMVGDSAVLFVANFSQYVTNQCDYVVLGLFHADYVVGLYFFAYNLSRRATRLLTTSLRDVLFPALSSIQDEPERQTRAFLRASRLLAIVGVPACLVQAAAAEPLFSAVLPRDRWDDAVPLVQILSIGAVFRTMGMPAFSLLRAQGRFRALTGLNLLVAALFLVGVIVGAALGAATGVAFAVALLMAVTGPLQIYIAIRHGGGGWRDVFAVHAVPCAIGAIAVGGAWGLARLVPAWPARDWIQLVLIPVAATTLYLPLIRLAAADDCADLVQRLRAILQRRRQRS